MPILVGFLVIFLLAQIAFRLSDRFSDLMEFFGILGTVVSVLGLVVSLIFMPINRMDVRAEIAGFNAVRNSRASAVEIEAAAWRMKVAEQNSWLASTQFYNSSCFDWWIPDEIDALKPIQ